MEEAYEMIDSDLSRNLEDSSGSWVFPNVSMKAFSPRKAKFMVWGGEAWGSRFGQGIDLADEMTKNLNGWIQLSSPNFHANSIIEKIENAMGSAYFIVHSTNDLILEAGNNLVNQLVDVADEEYEVLTGNNETSQDRERILSEAYNIRQAMATLIEHDWAGLKILLHVKENTKLSVAELRDENVDVEEDILLTTVIGLISHRFLNVEDEYFCLTAHGENILGKLLEENQSELIT